MELKEKIQKQLLKVKSPSRYIGGEFNSVVKDKSKVDVRFAFCFPDAYDVGMSHIGMKILYSLKNARENWWCERVLRRGPITRRSCVKMTYPFTVWRALTP